MTPDRETVWKELIEQEPERFVEFFYPDVHADLDWTRDMESLEQEFRKLAPESLTGKRIVDKLLRAFRKANGDPRYLHFEFQAYFEADFPRRLYEYNSAAELRYGSPVVSLPILIDDNPRWKPKRYQSELYGTRRTLTFRTVKIADFQRKAKTLEKHPNPVALFVLAYLEGRRLEGDHEATLAAKVRFARRLKEYKLLEAEGKRWMGFLDWLLWLPEEYNARLRAELEPTEKGIPCRSSRIWSGSVRRRGDGKASLKGSRSG
jgi:hypothetical protein